MGSQIERQTKARLYAAEGRFLDFCRLVGYKPHEAQRVVHGSDAWTRVVRWGRRAGKTLLAGVEASFVLLQDHKRVWVVAPDHDLAGRVWDVITEILIDDLGFEPVTRTTRPPYRLAFEWGSICEGKSTEHSARKSLVGAELDFLVWDEVAKSPPGIWERRLHPGLGGADHRGRALLISTPEGFNHFHEFCERGRTDPDWEGFHAKSEANPHLPREIIEEARRTYTPETFAQEWEAEFRSFVGQVYKEFRADPAGIGHTRPLRYDPELPLYLAFDFGVENPFVCLWLQVTGGDVVRLIDEYYKQGWSTLENGRAVLAHHQAAEYGEIEWAVGDPSGKDAIRILRRELGLPVVRARRQAPRGRQGREKPATVELVRRFLREDRLFVDPDRCPNTVREFNRYRYPEHLEDANATEEPLKVDDHTMDALRYWFNTYYGKRPVLRDPTAMEMNETELRAWRDQRRSEARYVRYAR